MTKTHLRVVMYCPDTNPYYDALPLGYIDKIKLISEVLTAASAKVADDPDTVLPVFVGPEWLFRRKQDPSKDTFSPPYTSQEKEAIVSGLQALSTSKFPKWLLIPGSITWGLVKANKFCWYNTMPIIYNGQALRLYHKQHDADNFGGTVATNSYKEKEIDKPAIASSKFISGESEEIKPEVAPYEGGAVFTNWKLNPDKHRLIPSPEAVSPFFTCEGRKFAAEICADFATATAMRAYMQYTPIGEGIDAHIVIAAGIPAEASFVGRSVVRQDGYLLICDTGTSSYPKTAVYKVTERQGTIKASAQAYDSNSTNPIIKTDTIASTTSRFKTGNPSGTRRFDRTSEMIIFNQLLALPAESVNQTITSLTATIGAKS